MRDGKARIPDASEMQRMLAVVASRRYPERNKAIMMMSYGLGMRVSEIASVDMKDVLNMDGTLKTEFTIKARNSKSKRPRTVFLTNKRVIAAISEYIAYLLTTGDVALDAPLFTSQKRRRLTGKTLGIVIATIYRKAGLEGCKTHSGRRSFATTLLVEKGVDIKSVMLLMGHANIKMTAEYVEVSPEKLKAAAEGAA